ncbi:MAG: FecR family protein [Woeseiaceae bacterium]
MKPSAKKGASGGEKTVERILSSAEPRPVPSPGESEAVRQHVLAEWQSVARRRKKQRHRVSLAIAASVLMAVFVVFNSLRINGIADVQIASIDKSFGSVYVLGENTEMLEGSDLMTVARGQTLVTDGESGVGLTWEGGASMRIDAKTRVEFVDRNMVHLHSGRVYFDSAPERLAARQSTGPVVALTIRTEHGTVKHIGTQYMVRSDFKGLTVSVREGEVELGTTTGSDSATGGQQLQFPGGRGASIVNIRTYGDNWQWTEQLSPDINVEGRSIFDFLRWVSHETGLGIEFESPAVEDAVKTDTLKGLVNVNPTDALRIWMMGVDLDWKIENGVIRIGSIDQPND